MSKSPELFQQHERKPVGPIAATIIIVLILALGGLYLFAKQAEQIRAQKAAAANSSL